jgi:hypothetical protein
MEPIEWKHVVGNKKGKHCRRHLWLEEFSDLRNITETFTLDFEGNLDLGGNFGMTLSD